MLGLRKNSVPDGIQDRMRTGAHENTPYLPTIAAPQRIKKKIGIIEQKKKQIDLMRVEELNAARKLKGKLGALADQKKLIMAGAYGGVQRIDALLRAGIKNKPGTKLHESIVDSMLRLVYKPAQGLYKPKNFNEEENAAWLGLP
jgi:hypothetical protein